MDSIVETTDIMLANPPDKQELTRHQQKAHAILEQARGLVVENADDFQRGGVLVAAATLAMKELEEFCRPNIKRLDYAHKAAVADLQQYTVPLGKAKKIASDAMGTWRREQQRLEDEKARKRREQLQKEAEDRRLAEAEHLEKLGRKAEADAALERPVATPIVTVQSEIPKIPGQHPVITWRARVIDASLVPDAYKLVDMTGLNALARSLKDKAVVPGVEFYPDETTAQRSV